MLIEKFTFQLTGDAFRAVGDIQVFFRYQKQ